MSEHAERGSMTAADIQELLDLGVFQEANRRFFHILGLEIVVRLEDSGDYSLAILDGRGELGGIRFTKREPRWSQTRRERANRISNLLAGQIAFRWYRMGFRRQPVADL